MVGHWLMPLILPGLVPKDSPSDSLVESGQSIRVFELLRDSLQTAHDAYTGNVWGTLTAVMVAIGWIMTSDNARAFLRSSKSARRTMFLAVVTVWFGHVMTLSVLNRKADLLWNLTMDAKLKHLRSLVVGLEIPAGHIYVSFILTGALFTVLLAFIQSLGVEQQDNKEGPPVAAEERVPSPEESATDTRVAKSGSGGSEAVTDGQAKDG